MRRVISEKYECERCNHRYREKSVAGMCESFPAPSPAFKVGDLVWVYLIDGWEHMNDTYGGEISEKRWAAGRVSFVFFPGLNNIYYPTKDPHEPIYRVQINTDREEIRWDTT